ncbi:HNH endonuclease [Roseomonas sp. ACRSG]|nr:HNH endonuclease [Roseomonas sp. ACRSG]
MINSFVGYPVAAAEPERRSRRRNRLPPVKRNANPSVCHVLADGRPCVLVELTGSAAQGRRMLLDTEDWTRISLELGRRWTLHDRLGTTLSVVGQSKAAKEWARASGLRGSSPCAYLARVLIGRDGIRGMVVRHRNGNPLDLRRVNLLPLPRREARGWKPDMPPAAIDHLN